MIVSLEDGLNPIDDIGKLSDQCRLQPGGLPEAVQHSYQHSACCCKRCKDHLRAQLAFLAKQKQMPCLVYSPDKASLWCSLRSVLEGERQEFDAACKRYKEEKQALMEQVQARRDIVRQVVEAGVLPAADSPARSALPSCPARPDTALKAMYGRAMHMKWPGLLCISWRGVSK